MMPLWLKLIYFVVAVLLSGMWLIAIVDEAGAELFSGPNRDYSRTGCIFLGIVGIAMFVGYRLTYGGL